MERMGTLAQVGPAAAGHHQDMCSTGACRLFSVEVLCPQKMAEYASVTETLCSEIVKRDKSCDVGTLWQRCTRAAHTSDRLASRAVRVRLQQLVRTDDYALLLD